MEVGRARFGAEYRSVDRRAPRADHHLHGDHAADADRVADPGSAAPSAESEADEPDERTIVVQVMNGGKLMINQDQSNWNDLGPRLSDIFKERADKIAFVKGDDNVEFAQVARAIDIMRGSGIDHVGLITAKIEAGQ